MRVEITTDAAGASGSGWPATTYLMSYQSIEDFLPLAKKHGTARRIENGRGCSTPAEPC